MKRSQKWNTLQICPRRDSNPCGNDLLSNALPTRPRRRPIRLIIIWYIVHNKNITFPNQKEFIYTRNVKENPHYFTTLCKINRLVLSVTVVLHIKSKNQNGPFQYSWIYVKLIRCPSDVYYLSNTMANNKSSIHTSERSNYWVITRYGVNSILSIPIPLNFIRSIPIPHKIYQFQFNSNSKCINSNS